MQQYNCQNGQSWYDVCLNTYGSLDYLGKLVSDNGGELNIQPTTNTVIYWDQSLVKDSSLLSLIKNNGYVYNTGVSIPLPYIQKFTAGVSPITFVSDGSDGWHVGIVANPATVQLPSGQSIDFVNYHIIHYLAGVETINLNGNLTADDTINTGANGAGVYEVNLSYTLLDRSYFSVAFLFVVDATNNILHSWSNNGTHVNSVSGLTMDLSADIVDALNMPLTWKAFNGTLNSVGTGKDAVITLPVGTTDIGIEVTLDAVFSDYPDPTYLSWFSVVIS